MDFKSIFKKKDKKKIDYLSLNWMEKLKIMGFFSLKWGGIILFAELIIWLLIDRFTQYEPDFFFGQSLLYIPGALLIVGGCIGGLSRYNLPPKMRIIEPDDQAVTPSEFQIRVKYDSKIIDPDSINIVVNEKSLPKKIDTEKGVVYVPKVFKNPPKKAVSLLLQADGKEIESKKTVTDKIRIICDPEYDEEDYLDYWEFKREDDTYWGKEMTAAGKHAKRNVTAMKLILLAFLLLAANYIVSLIYIAISNNLTA
ncbi:MAG: hypothetical protein HGN29_02515 [Asgard group archaeon]|nr:hypothetical protein [Asgard group archaeon]